LLQQVNQLGRVESPGELEALTAPETRAALVAFRIELVGFRQPAGDPVY